MKAHEIINFCKPFVEKILTTGINLNDIQYLDLYNDYVRMKKEGHKVTYLVAYLSEQYEVSERKVYQLVRSFESEV